jgi:hypothetical protein
MRSRALHPPAGRARAAAFGTAVVCLVVAAAGLGAATAHAGVADATCAGTVASTFDPALRTFAQPTAGSDETVLATCASLGDATIRSGRTAVSYSASMSCVAPLNGGQIVETIAWSNGTTSTFESTAANTTVAGESVSTQIGAIVAGTFRGDTAVKITRTPTLDLLSCLLGPGIASRQGVATLVITSVR